MNRLHQSDERLDRTCNSVRLEDGCRALLLVNLDVHGSGQLDESDALSVVEYPDIAGGGMSTSGDLHQIIGECGPCPRRRNEHE